MKKIKPYNHLGEKHGYWEGYHDNGILDYKGHFVKNKANGYWEVNFNMNEDCYGLWVWTNLKTYFIK